MLTSPSDPRAPRPPRVYDLAVIGAGPAGLAAAVTAAGLGLDCALLDAAERTGGQYYRHPAPESGARRPGRLHHGWRTYTRLGARLDAHIAAGRVELLAGHHVWAAEQDAGAGGWRLHANAGPPDAPDAVAVRATAVLLATGAYERQLPFPGWTLPGVVTAGGAQAMLKAGLVLPGRRIVVAGSGPLLLAVAASLAAAGATVPALLEAGSYRGYLRAAGVPARVPAKGVEAVRHGAALLRHGIRLRPRSAVVEAHGTDRITGVTLARLDRDWRPVPGTERRIACDALAVGHGLVPQIDLATELGAATRVTPDGAVALAVDDAGRTSLPGLWAAGEVCGVGGADLALLEGEAAARSVAAAPAPAGRARRRERLRAFAGLMGAVHRPGPGWPGWLRPETEVCRCEEVPVGRIREAVDELGAIDARTVKLLTRAGMGWCQGRTCGPAVVCLAGGGPPRPDGRPLACPVPLSRLAAGPEA